MHALTLHTYMLHAYSNIIYTRNTPTATLHTHTLYAYSNITYILIQWQFSG